MAEVPKVERELSTRELVEHAIDEVKLLAKAEVLHAKLEVRADLHKAMRAGIALGAGAVLSVCGLTLLFVAVALALPFEGWSAALLVGVALLVIGGISALVGARKVPKKPMERTQQRLLEDVRVTREQFV